MKVFDTTLADLYTCSVSTVQTLKGNHKRVLDHLATWYIGKDGKKRKRKQYNGKQLAYMVKNVFKDTPEGYNFKNGTFVPVND